MTRSPHSPVSFDRDGSTVRVADDLEGAEVTIEIDGDPTLTPALPDVFLFPVDEAVSVTVSRLRVCGAFGRSLWDAEGKPVENLTTAHTSLPRATYHASITGSVKLHLRIEDAMVRAEEYLDDADRSIVEMHFDEPTSVAIGARSLRSHPSSAITVPDDPEALLEALPYLASSIKEFTPECSWPTLRQHPPAIERGDRLSIPPDVRRPETGVEIRLPPTYEHCYTVAPLAFYLGADLVAGDAPALVLENGHVEPLETTEASLSERVTDVLGRCLLLDSLVREAGYQTVGNAEYDHLAPQLPFYPPNLYDLSPSERLLEYLDVAHEVLSPYRPRWPKRAVLRPDPADAVCLPGLLHELARIDVARSPDAVPPTVTTDEDAVVGCDGNAGARRPDALLTAHTFPASVTGTCRLRAEAMQLAPTIERPTPDRAHLTLATDDPERAGAFRRFADRLSDETTISVLERPTASTLCEALCDERTALYCEQPASEDGIRCADRTLRLGEVGDVATPVVWLADAASGSDGDTLVSAGAVAVASTAGVPDRERVCGALAQLLGGFSVADAVYTAGVDRDVDVRFVGDASVTVVRSVNSAPTMIDLATVDSDRFTLTLKNYPTGVLRQGSTVRHVGSDDPVGRIVEECLREGHRLIGTIAAQPSSLTAAEVASLVAEGDFAVRLDGRLLVGTGELPGADGSGRDRARSGVSRR
ncbi:hypothetical protein [Halovivax cerinus]|uniref:Uncharacterized protein n=1 Tax=Halovivax cerinus TaxID=1487865 RepID=A0ABD5NU68_9EURY|nr:hypothetical protein [Halovivax cerinus]